MRARLSMNNTMKVRSSTWLVPSRKKTSYLFQPATSLACSKTTQKVSTLIMNHMEPVTICSRKLPRKPISRERQLEMKAAQRRRWRISAPHRAVDAHGPAPQPPRKKAQGGHPKGLHAEASQG